MTIAIDGPAGAGKSTVARGAARQLGYAYIDTGALYRSIALAALRAGVPPGDEASVTALLPRVALDVRYIDNTQHVYLDGEDVSEAIRDPKVSLATSCVSKYKAVRAFLLQTQRDLAHARDSILDGRDIGTVVLPNADVKVFLTAQPEERARRRWEEQKARGVTDPFETVLAEVLARDAQDMNRAESPLRPAPDSVLLDTTNMDLDESVQALLAIIAQHHSIPWLPLGGAPAAAGERVK